MPSDMDCLARVKVWSISSTSQPAKADSTACLQPGDSPDWASSSGRLQLAEEFVLWRWPCLRFYSPLEAVMLLSSDGLLLSSQILCCNTMCQDSHETVAATIVKGWEAFIAWIIHSHDNAPYYSFASSSTSPSTMQSREPDTLALLKTFFSCLPFFDEKV